MPWAVSWLFTWLLLKMDKWLTPWNPCLDPSYGHEFSLLNCGLKLFFRPLPNRVSLPGLWYRNCLLGESGRQGRGKWLAFPCRGKEWETGKELQSAGGWVGATSGLLPTSFSWHDSLWPGCLPPGSGLGTWLPAHPAAFARSMGVGSVCRGSAPRWSIPSLLAHSCQVLPGVAFFLLGLACLFPGTPGTVLSPAVPTWRGQAEGKCHQRAKRQFECWLYLGVGHLLIVFHV
jgi:hypothetical protein